MRTLLWVMPYVLGRVERPTVEKQAIGAQSVAVLTSFPAWLRGQALVSTVTIQPPAATNAAGMDYTIKDLKQTGYSHKHNKDTR